MYVDNGMRQEAVNRVKRSDGGRLKQFLVVEGQKCIPVVSHFFCNAACPFDRS